MPWTDSVVREVLPNGLTVLVQRDSSAHVVAVVTHVKAGYFDEPDEWVGIAHVLEHMFFKGTMRLGPGALARETQLLGGYLNAGTIYDKTVYFTVVPSAAFERALALQADALVHAALEPDELRRELEVIIQEAKRKLDSPPAVTAETLYELLFTTHRMRRWRIGTEAGLRGLVAADVRSYYETRYTPDKVVLALTGDLDVSRALALARRTYADWHRPPVAIGGSPPEPPARRARLRVLRGDVERPLAAVGWRTVGALHPDAPALDVAAAVLGAGRASWLVQAVRTPGFASEVGSTHYTPGDVGVFDMALTSDVGRVEEAVRRSLSLADLLADPGPDTGQLERVRAMLAVLWGRRFESVDGRATALAEFEALGGYALADRYYEGMLAVNAADVRRVASEYLRRDAVCATLYLPEGAAGGLDEEDWPVSPLVRGGAPVAAPAWVAAAARPRSRPTASRTAGDVYHMRFDGADVITRPRKGTGLVSVGVYFPGVTVAETPAEAGISALLVRSALRGAGGFGAEQLAAAAEALGGSIVSVVDADLVGWHVTVRAEFGGEAARLLRMIAGTPTLGADDVMLERTLQADDAAGLRDDMFRYPIQRVLRAAFPHDPYGLPSLGDPETIVAIAPDAVRAWHDRLRAVRGAVVVVGDLEPLALLDAGAAFADWPGRGGGARADPTAWTAGRNVEMRDKAQTALALAFPAPPATTRERFVLIVTSALLSGLAGRLFQVLREERALAYTVQLAPWQRLRGGAMIAYIATSPEREAEARAAMLAELGRLAQDEITSAELERARRYAAGLVAIRRQHGAAVAGDLVDAWVRGTLGDFADEEQLRLAVTAEAIRAAAARIFAPDHRAEFVVRGAGKGS